MSEVRWIGFVTGSDPEHDVGGVRSTVDVTFFGEHCAQLRIVGGRFYIKEPDPDQASSVMASDPPTINQPASKQAVLHRWRCSLTSTRSEQGQGRRRVGSADSHLLLLESVSGGARLALERRRAKARDLDL